jgi:hypothetical protein
MLLLSGALCVNAFAAQIGSKEIDVKAKYSVVSNTPASYSIDLSWTDMTFTYTRMDTHIWDPLTHTYKTGSKSGWDKTRGSITVTNHSNVDVRVEVTYLPEPDTGIKGILKNASVTLKAGVVGDYAGADSMTATLTVSGTPKDIANATEAKVGKLRITIR